MSAVNNVDSVICKLGEGKKIKELQSFINKTSNETLIQALVTKIERSNAANLWNFILMGFTEDRESGEKRFSCVKAVLAHLNNIEVKYKYSFDLINRLFLEFPKFKTEELIDIVDMAQDSLKQGDPKCVSWKDLIPEIVKLLSALPNLSVNGIQSTGSEYRSRIVRNLCTIKWPLSVLTPIANMFREMILSDEETSAILTKFCCSLQKMGPLELPALAFQLFSMCNTAQQIVVPILAMQRYFHKHYYKKLYTDMESDSTDYNSIDLHSDKELREAEETILHHLSYCTQFKISENNLANTLRTLTSTPDMLLTPFVLSAILTMTRCNRELDAPLSSSLILPCLRNAIKNNEDEKELAGLSAWCRDTMHASQVDIDRMFTVLIDQNKEGKDVVTPGLVNLAFVLLKTKNSQHLNRIGISFLQKFIKKRFIFGMGVVKKLTEWMILDQEAIQYNECLTALSLTDTYTISECTKEIKYVLSFFTGIQGNYAMRLMSFILAVVKISHTIRDEFIDVLKKAMFSRQPATCKMGVYGFCMLLKQLNNSNSHRGTPSAGSFFTQQNISGFSLMSQATLNNRNNPQRHFDMLTLEIIGLLRNCFSESLEMKETLYEGLTRSVELNPKLTPHILQFIDMHFRSYFDVEDGKCSIKFEKVVYVKDDGKYVEVRDNLGRLVDFVGLCIITSDKYELNYDTNILKDVFAALTERIVDIKLEDIEIHGNIDHKMNQVFYQLIGTIEALMAFNLWTSKPENQNIQKLYKLYKHHSESIEIYKGYLNTQNKKPVKRTKAANETEVCSQNLTVNGTLVKKVIFQPEVIWNLTTMERFLRLLHDDVVSFASQDQTGPLRANRDLVRFTLESASSLIESLRSQPDYKQITHSRRILKSLSEITRLIYERCIKRLPNLWTNFDVRTAYLAAECFYQSLLSADVLFKRKFEEYLKSVDFQSISYNNDDKILSIVQNVIEKYMEDANDIDEGPAKTPVVLFQALEILYRNIAHDEILSKDAYNWLFKFCETNELDSKDFGIVHRLLFTQRIKTNSGIFFNTVAMHLAKIFQQIDETVELSPQFELKSITEATAESCFLFLLATIKKQIEDVEYFISKCKSLFAKTRITSEDDREQCIQALKTIERSICSQLIHICNTLVHLTNACIPLGVCMDSLIKILMQIYICLTNLVKHFTLRHNSISVSFQTTKFEQLLRVCGKPLAANIYSLITHIEANILVENERRHDPKADKVKIMKETKFLPKLIMRIENFNKFVIMLSKKTNSHLPHLLHIGTVRDFRIKTADLKEAINETLTHSSQIDVDESMLEEMEQNDSDDEQSLSAETLDENLEELPISGGSTTGVELRNESDKCTESQVLKNLAKLNKTTKKRAPVEKRNDDEPNAKKTRVRKPRIK